MGRRKVLAISLNFSLVYLANSSKSALGSAGRAFLRYLPNFADTGNQKSL
jgi:hypothetical protein